MKLCKKCNIEKENSDFYREKKSKDGLRGSCKLCMGLYQSNIDRKHRSSIVKKSYYNNIDKNKKYYQDNKDYIKEQRRNRYYLNKESENKKSRQYSKNNKDRLNKYRNKYHSDRIKIDPIYKISSQIRQLIRMSFYKNGYTKRSKTYKILGCSFDEFKSFIESKFSTWMTWENHGSYTGNYNETWQLDHIIPISLATCEEDVIILNHYSNFQPLCSKVNIEKSNLVKITHII